MTISVSPYVRAFEVRQHAAVNLIHAEQIHRTAIKEEWRPVALKLAQTNVENRRNLYREAELKFNQESALERKRLDDLHGKMDFTHDPMLDDFEVQCAY